MDYGVLEGNEGSGFGLDLSCSSINHMGGETVPFKNARLCKQYKITDVKIKTHNYLKK